MKFRNVRKKLLTQPMTRRVLPAKRINLKTHCFLYSLEVVLASESKERLNKGMLCGSFLGGIGALTSPNRRFPDTV